MLPIRFRSGESRDHSLAASMRYLIDTQLPKALGRKLREIGYSAEHALELALGQSSDNDLWQYAIQSQSVIITKDEDFAEWILSGRPGPSVVWLRIGNCTNTELIVWLLPHWPEVIEALEHGERLVELI